MLATASTETEFRAICDSAIEKSPFIRSMQDWRFARRFKLKGIGKLTDGALNEFEIELSFKNGGLAHAKYKKIKDEINDEELVDFFALFGIGEKYFRDHENYECSNRATCTSESASICTSNCIV